MSKFFSLLFICLFSFSAFSQKRSNFREREIAIQQSNIQLGEALLLIAEHANFSLSFNPAILPDSIVSLKYSDRTAKEIFKEVLPPYIFYNELGSSVILQKKKEIEQKSIHISGQILHRLPIDQALVFEVNGLASTFTNEDGKFSLKVKKPNSSNIGISVHKEGFKDSLILLPSKTQEVSIKLEKKALKAIPKKEFNLTKIPRLFVPKKVQIRNENITAHLYRKYQLSLVPSIGTNLKMGGLVENTYSLNVIGGYSLGNSKVEIGGAFNINRIYAEGIQIAGAFNLVGESFKGVQIAGWGNLNFGESEGVQLAGAYNQSKSLKGTQISGGLNLVTDSAEGLQIAPINYSKVLVGKQIGIVNLADSASGTPIGLFSYVKKNGYNSLSLSTNELTYTNLDFKMGVPSFYNIFSAGFGYQYNDFIWQYGIGVGTEKVLNDQRNINNEFLFHWLFKANKQNQTNYGLAKWKLLFQNKKQRKFRLSYGPTVNVLFQSNEQDEMSHQLHLPYCFFKTDVGNLELNSWVGVHLSIGIKSFLTPD
ncbi:MAG: hypothetical protein CMC96_12240 [Flavobacteriales bacterium]|nr:hypothetical protein [Flavobacteriales bacterium]|tara:strand:- start:481 stop:2091 length:1611 start_codon:yes stop_codon:yes gene_type:complete